MNYTKTYYQIIKNRLENPVEGYVERHHIIPKSEGGADSPDNIVALTAREHYIAHLLLAKIYNDYKMWYAVYCMTWRGPNHNRKFHTNSRLYESIKIKCSLYKSQTFSGDGNGMYGKHHSVESRQKISLTRKSRIASGDIEIYHTQHSDDQKAKISYKAKLRLSDKTRHPMYGKKHSEETKMNISLANKGKTAWNRGKKCGHLSDEHKRKLSELNGGKNNPMYGSTYRWVNDGTRNYRWTKDKDIPPNFKIGRISKRNSGI